MKTCTNHPMRSGLPVRRRGIAHDASESVSAASKTPRRMCTPVSLAAMISPASWRIPYPPRLLPNKRPFLYSKLHATTLRHGGCTSLRFKRQASGGLGVVSVALRTGVAPMHRGRPCRRSERRGNRLRRIGGSHALDEGTAGRSRPHAPRRRQARRRRQPRAVHPFSRRGRTPLQPAGQRHDHRPRPRHAGLPRRLGRPRQRRRRPRGQRRTRPRSPSRRKIRLTRSAASG